MSAALSSTQKSTYRVETDVEAILEALNQRPETREQTPVTSPGCSQDPQVGESEKDSPARPPALEEGVPPLTTFYMYLTEGCNLACRHCWVKPTFMRGEATGGHVDLEKLLDACRNARSLGLGSVKLTGGEPLLHPDFVGLVRGLKALDLGVWMETNLTLLTPSKAEAIVDTMKFVSTSLDSATEEGHDSFRGTEGSFRTACEALRLLSPHLKLQVIMSVHSGNAHEIEDFIVLAKELGAASVKFNLIHSVGRADQMSVRGQVLDVRELTRLGHTVENELGPKHGIDVFWSWPPAFVSLGRLTQGRRFQHCGIHNILGVLASGHYALCGIGQTIDELVFGSLEDDIVELWNHHQMLRRLRTEMPGQLEGICSKCIHRKTCKAYCVAVNYQESQAFTKSYWFCEEAFAEGLFPETRMIPSGKGES